MQVFVTTVDGDTITIEIQKTDTIRVLKDKIKEKTDAEPSIQRLVFSGKPLMDDITLQEYSIHENSTIFLVLRVRGGMQIFDRVLTRKPITLETEPAYRIERIQKGQELLYFQENILKMTTLFKTNQF